MLLSHQSFESLQVTATYEVLDPGALRHQLTFEAHIKALQQVRFYVRKTRWTGRGPGHRPRIVGSTDGPKQKIHGPILYEGQDQIFVVDLGREIAIGEKVWVRTAQLFVDHLGTAATFLRHSVRYPLGRLELRVRLPAELSADVRFQIRDIKADEKIGGPVPLVPSVDGCFSKDIDNPETGQEYKIQWLSG